MRLNLTHLTDLSKPPLGLTVFLSLHLSLPSPLQLAAEVGAHAVSHLEHVTATGIEAMAQAEVVGVLLPTTAYILHLQPPPAREMIKKGTTPTTQLNLLMILSTL